MDIDFSALEQLLTNTGWIEGIIQAKSFQYNFPSI